MSPIGIQPRLAPQKRKVKVFGNVTYSQEKSKLKFLGNVTYRKWTKQNEKEKKFLFGPPLHFLNSPIPGPLV